MEHFLIKKYFPDLKPEQLSRYEQLAPLYEDWNSKINLISRKDMENFYEHHVLHSLAIAKYFDLLPGMKVMDIGTGGGFPGIPLAIMYPQTRFLLVDSIGKKIKVVQDVKEKLGLENVTALNDRAENIKEKFDVIVSRAVTQLPDFVKWCNGKLRITNDIEAGGILYLKGGDIKEELRSVPKNWKRNMTAISRWFEEPYFEGKYVIQLY
ncbi:MAG: 16S rRNA (guanine(527)-N(7))-methyltransferase RsmG [Bacteroidales bacterium]|nr:16S rRNA (guanine(527)-N(7))-methyltransferase RsmG [Bacteroidales bacterium]